MRTRRIKMGVLAAQAVTYRVFIVACMTATFWIVTGDLARSFGICIGWQLLNAALYYLFHFGWASLFRLGK